MMNGILQALANLWIEDIRVANTNLTVEKKQKKKGLQALRKDEEEEISVMCSFYLHILTFVGEHETTKRFLKTA